MPQRATLMLAVALLVLTTAVYAPVRNYAFLSYDDGEYVTENPHVNAGLTRDGVVWAWTGVHQATWHPLTTLSHMLDCQLFGLNPGPHHLGNVALHVLNTLLLFGVLVRMTAQPWRSAWVAGLFALHPLHVESVAWISERKDVLSTLFFMLTLWAYVTYVGRPGWRTYAVLVVAYIAALLSKPMVVTLPFVLLLLDVWPLRRVAWREQPGSGRTEKTLGAASLVSEKLPLLLPAGIVSVITYVTQAHAGTMAVPTPLSQRFANAIVAYATYLAKALWPAGLAVFYPFDASLPAWRVLSAAALLILISAAVLRGARRHPYLLTGWLWYLGMLAPVIGLIRFGDHSIADRYTYVPLVGIFIMAAWGIPELLGRWRHRQAACAAAAAGVLLAYTVVTVRQLRFWRDSLSLFEHALTVTHDNYIAHFIIGSELQARGQGDAAFLHLEESLRIQPNFDKSNYDIGLIYAARGDLAAAKQHYLRALRLNPSYPKAHVSLGQVLAAQGDVGGAVTHYREAIRLDPRLPAAHNNLAIELEGMGKTNEAIDHYTEGVRLDPKHAEARCNLAAALISAGRLPEAIEQFRAALQLAPHLVEARVNLATAYAQTGQIREAILALDDVLHERPDLTAAEVTLAWLLATAEDPHLRDGARAVQLAEKAAVTTNHRDADALNSLAAAYAESGRFADAADSATQALTLARGSGQIALAHALEERLAQYRTGQPVRDRPRNAG